MKIVLAALDAGAAARPVLETALGLGELAGATVEAIHVRNGPTETPEALAARNRVPFRLLDGQVEVAILEAMAAPDVIAAALGARATPGGRRPAGRTAFAVLEGASKPVVVVPPEVVGVSRRPLRRLLVPLEGTNVSSRAIAERLLPLLARDVELLVLHVFTAATAPRALDHRGVDLSLWADEFLARHCPAATRIECRTGSVGDRVADLCAEEAADLVVLSWSQNAAEGHAAVVRDVLAHSAVPVLLLPAAPADVIDLRTGTTSEERQPSLLAGGRTAPRARTFGPSGAGIGSA